MAPIASVLLFLDEYTLLDVSILQECKTGIKIQ